MCIFVNVKQLLIKYLKTMKPIKKMSKLELMNFVKQKDYSKYFKINWTLNTTKGLRIQISNWYQREILNK